MNLVLPKVASNNEMPIVFHHVSFKVKEIKFGIMEDSKNNEFTINKTFVLFNESIAFI